MDKQQLNELVQPFVNKCAEKGKPITIVGFKPAYPGVSSSSQVVQVKGDWIEGVAMSEVLEFLIDVLWETTTPETRRELFTIQLMYKGGTHRTWLDSFAG